MPYDIRDFASLMQLEPHGPDVFVGIGPSYPWGRVYGGQAVAQALRAAQHTVEDRFRVHSLHAYFIRGGDFEEPIRFEVDRIRNGRSFTTRRVIARQSVGPILNLSASFQLREEQAEIQVRELPKTCPAPEDLEANDWGEILSRRPFPASARRGRGHCATWLRVNGMGEADEALQACALAYASDDIPTEAAQLLHPRIEEGGEAYDEAFVGASLDHAIWFHRDGAHDEWVLHDFDGEGLTGGRGLALGRIYSRSGAHLATVSQEILLRERTR